MEVNPPVIIVRRLTIKGCDALSVAVDSLAMSSY